MVTSIGLGLLYGAHLIASKQVQRISMIKNRFIVKTGSIFRSELIADQIKINQPLYTGLGAFGTDPIELKDASFWKQVTSTAYYVPMEVNGVKLWIDRRGQFVNAQYLDKLSF